MYSVRNYHHMHKSKNTCCRIAVREGGERVKLHVHSDHKPHEDHKLGGDFKKAHVICCCYARSQGGV